MKIEQYPLPKVAGISESLSGWQKFSQMDLTQGFLQMEIDEDQRAYYLHQLRSFWL